MGLFAVLVGIPLGLVVGRNGWHVITGHVLLSDVTLLATQSLRAQEGSRAPRERFPARHSRPGAVEGASS